MGGIPPAGLGKGDCQDGGRERGKTWTGGMQGKLGLASDMAQLWKAAESWGTLRRLAGNRQNLVKGF